MPRCDRPLGRRRLLTAGALVGGGLVLAACGGAGAEPVPSGGWRFVDDTGTEVVTPARPRRVLCYLNVAAALWDLGVRCAGTYAALTTPSPGDRSISGDLDRAVVPSFGDIWGELNLERVASARVDLVILAVMGGSPLLTEYDLAAVRKIAPVLWLELHTRPLDQTLATITRLAEALDGRPRPPDLDGRRADYHRARDAFASAIGAAPGLRTAFVAARPETLQLARPGYPTVALAKELGLTVVMPEGPGTNYTLAVSWENADRYPADLLLVDRRPYSQQPDQLAANPIWAALAPVRAGQVGAWNPEPVPSWSGVARELRALASAVGRAHRL